MLKYHFFSTAERLMKYVSVYKIKKEDIQNILYDGSCFVLWYWE